MALDIIDTLSVFAYEQEQAARVVESLLKIKSRKCVTGLQRSVLSENLDQFILLTILG